MMKPRRGEAFEDAWGGAVQDALAGLGGRELEEWLVALVSTRPDSEAAYHRTPASRAERAVAAMAA